jgi:hypothetical protein
MVQLVTEFTSTIKILVPEFPTADSAIAWLKQNGCSHLDWQHAYGIIAKHCNPNYTGENYCCNVALTFSDGSILPADDSIFPIRS